MGLATEIRNSFNSYVAENNDIHFSAGLLHCRPGLPVRQLAEQSEECLENAKQHNSNGKLKNAVSCFGEEMHWDLYKELLGKGAELEALASKFKLSTGFVYGMLTLLDMADDEVIKKDPTAARWRSYLMYRTQRAIAGKKRGLQQDVEEVATFFGGLFLNYKRAAKLPLFSYLYKNR